MVRVSDIKRALYSKAMVMVWPPSTGILARKGTRVTRTCNMEQPNTEATPENRLDLEGGDFPSSNRR